MEDKKMKVEMKINESLDAEIKESIEWALKQERGYNDGYPDKYTDNEGEVCYEYSTHSGVGNYTLYPDRSLIFRGRRNSFKDGNDLFIVPEEDVIEYEIYESREPNRSP